VASQIGVQRRRGRDVATGVALGAALGAALFLYLGTLTSSTTGASFTILFGSMFVISPGTVPALIASGVLALVVVAALTRVLLLTALSPDLAAARGAVAVAANAVLYRPLLLASALPEVADARGVSTRAMDCAS
jgi:zinc/manganese transport system permease protein